MTPLSPALSALAQQEMEWANAGEKLAVLNFSEKARSMKLWCGINYICTCCHRGLELKGLAL